MGTSILDVSDPAAPELVAQWPAPEHTHTHKVQIADGLLLVNHEKFPLGPKPVPGPYSAGLAIYRLDEPLAPEQVGWWDSGRRGVHRVHRRALRAHVGHPGRLPRPHLGRGRRLRRDRAGRGGALLAAGAARGRGRDARLAGGRAVRRATTRSSTAIARTSASTTRTWSCST